MAAKKKVATKKKAAVKKSVAKKTAPKKAVAKKKSVAKKAVVKKTAVKKAATKKAVPKKAAPQKATALKEAMTKTQLYAEIAEQTELSKKQVGEVFDALTAIVERHIKKRAVGQFTLPGLLKVKTVRKPATRARKGINPFTGEETMFKAKPARTVVKVLPLKKVKDMANN